jgi:hypothetical protein|tara:strand:- start:6990 stop:7178 length:189 start_codon:yes stop_codon:yes gene_type:complete
MALWIESRDGTDRTWLVELLNMRFVECPSTVELESQDFDIVSQHPDGIRVTPDGWRGTDDGC